MDKTRAVLALVIVFAGMVGFVVLYGHNTQDSSNKGVELTVYLCAAAKKPWQELVSEFERRTGIRVNAIYGSSGRLYALIKISGQGDVYAPASLYYMAKAVRDGLVYNDTVHPVAYLIPAIIVPKGNPADIRELNDLLKHGVKIAIGEPSHVVIGQYAVKVFKHNDMWPRVKDNIVVYAENFAKLASLVAMGAVDAIIGWHVAHYWYPNSTEIIWLKPGEVPEVSYIPIGVLKTSKNPKAAIEFIQFVTESDYAHKVWAKYHYPTSPRSVEELAPGARIPSIDDLLKGNNTDAGES
jgi:molybdate transport system substrate-binding protein